MSLDSLQTTWFVLVTVLWSGFFLLEGFDFGVGMLTPFVGRTDEERRSAKETTGPFWDGNEVWLIVAGGATFAAFPPWYSTMFSAYYLPLFLVLVGLIVRAAGTEWRERRETAGWRTSWDWWIAASCCLVPFLVGVLFGGLLVGIPIDGSQEFTGNLLDLVQPFAVFTGLLFVALCALQGLLFLRLKTRGPVYERATHYARWASLLAVGLFVVHMVWLQSAAGSGLIPGAGAWLALTFLVAAALLSLEHDHHRGWAFTCSAAGIVFTVVNVFATLYPNTMVSSTKAAYNLTINDSSAKYTLTLMTIIAVIMIPVVLVYTGWNYWVFRGRMRTSPDPMASGATGSRTGAGRHARSRIGVVRFVDPRLLRRARAVRVALALDVAAGVARTALLLVQVVLVAHVVAGLVDDGTRPSTATLVTLAAVALVRAVLAVLVERIGRHAALATQSALRHEMVDRALRPDDGLVVPDVPGFAVAAVQGVEGLEVYFGRYVPQVVLAAIVPPVVLVWSAVVDIESALIMLVTLPLIPLFGWLIGRSTADRARENHRALVQLSTHFLDLVRGLPTLRAFNRGTAQGSRLAETAERYRQTTMRTLRLAFLSGTVLDLVTTFSIALVAVTLGVRLVGGSVSLVAALTVLLLVPEMYAPMRQVTALFHASADGLAAAERILAVLDRPRPGDPERSAAADAAEDPDDADTVVRLRSVTVQFPDRAAPALDHVDLALCRGDVVAVVGASGAGKTTLGRVALGLVAPAGGSVTTGGHPIAADPDGWRARVAWSAQRPALLHATVAENIALGRPGTPRADIVAAAAAAGAHAFVAALPAGYDTVIGDGGRGLSAGQRQRLGLARALARPAELVVLDEPTAHLDAEAARGVIDAIRARAADRAVLILTHDPALAAVADRTLHLDAGRVVGSAATVGEVVA